PPVASIGSGRKSWRNRRLRQNGRWSGGRAAAPPPGEKSREKPTAHGTYGECAAASKKEKRPPNFIAAKDRGFPRLDSAIYGRVIDGRCGAVDRVRRPSMGAGLWSNGLRPRGG